MGINQIIKDLKSIFNEDNIKKSHCDELKDIIKELNKKQNKIQTELNSESSKKKRKQLKIELKIVEIQLKKATKKRSSLKRCK